MTPEFFTIGAYGTNAERFFGALETAKIDTFCDVRARRGVRGHAYAFANSTRLQEELARREIRYLHFPDLSPSEAVRNAQAEEDASHGIARRKRTELGPAFVRGYEREVLKGFDSKEFLQRLPAESRRVVLFCVEHDPTACHRGLLAERLERDLELTVTHLRP